MKTAVMIGSVACAMSFAHAASGARLIALWSMNEEAGASVLHDASGNGRDAVTDAGVSIQAGMFGTAAGFPGTAGQGVATVSLPAFSNLTVAAWIFYTAADNLYPRVIQSSVCVIHFNPPQLATSPMRFNVANPGVVNTGTWNVPSTEFVSNRWTHVAVTYLGESTNSVPVFYINGIRQKPPVGTCPVAPVYNAGTAMIGNTSDKIRPFGGRMDDVRIYDGILTDREIYALYTDRPPQADVGVTQTVARMETRLSGRLINTNPFVPNWGAATEWRQVAGPGQATIGRPDRLETSVILPDVGEYLFCLTASNGLAVASVTGRVTRVTAVTQNNAPIVDVAQSETTCARPFNVLLKGSVSDDGVPGQVSTRWRKVSGPGGVFFDNRYALETYAVFSMAGVYEVALEADDGDKTGSATVDVAVTDSTAPVPDPNAAWWPLDEPTTNSLVVDAFGGRTLSLLNGARLMPGKEGNGVRFPQAKSRALSVEANPDGFTNDFNAVTLAAWVNFAGSTNLNSYPRIIQGNNFSWIWEPQPGGGRLRFSMTATNSSEIVWLSSGNLLPSNGWHHIAVAVDRTLGVATRPQFYLNGRLCGVTSPDHVGVFKSMVGALNIGGNGSDRNLDAVLDDVRVYDRVLTESEVQSLAVDRDNNHAPAIEMVETQVVVKTGERHVLPVAAWDDGLPSEEAFVSAWDVVAGDAGQVWFDDASTVDSGVTFTRSGLYTLRLTVTDGVFTDHAGVDILAVPSGTMILVR